jgi:sulfite exporter TauE/SafE/copper chaperone CopZ
MVLGRSAAGGQIVGTKTERDAAQRLTVPVTGMTCESCEKRVTRALRRLPGIDAVSVSAVRGAATVHGSDLPARDRIDAAIRSAGYEPTAPAWLSRDRSVWRTVLLAAAAVGLTVWLVTALGPADLTSGLADPSRGGLVLVLVLGLAAGVSTCMAMVGGLVLGFSAAHAASVTAAGGGSLPFTTRMRPQVAFNLGRIGGFAVLGALLGALGSTMSLPARLLAVLVLGVAVVMGLLGVRLTGISPRVAAWSPRLPGGLSRVLGVDTATEESYSHARTALVGAATFFLPCGFTQAVQVYALSTASPMAAGAIMATFAIGTTPGLLALGSVPELTTGTRQVMVLRVVGVVVLAFALLNVQSGLNLLGLSTGGSGAAAGRTASSNVTVVDGAQTVRMTQTPRGYSPADTVIYAGLPTTWIIEGTSPFDCSAFLRVPSLGVEVDLAKGSNTVALPAMEAGDVPFTCVMGMYSGTLIVVEPPVDGPGQPAAGSAAP